MTRKPQTCSQCGALGHNAKTCGRESGVREDGARVRKLAPGVSGAELAALAPIRKPLPRTPGQPIDVELRVRVRIEVEVVTLNGASA